MADEAERTASGFNLDRAYEGPPDLDATEEDKAHYVLARYAVQNDHYNGLYQTWIKPIFFLVGKQWLKWNEEQFTYAPDNDVPEWRQQPVTNWTFAVYRTLIAKLTKQRPTLETVPPSGDSEDREAAKLGQSIVEFLWRHLKKPKKVVNAIGWLLATGNVAFNVDWDVKAGELRPRQVLIEVPHPELEGETVDVNCACDEDGEPTRRAPAFEGETAPDGGDPYDLEATPVMEPIGEISFDVDDPLSYRFNAEATTEDDAEEFFSARLWPKSRVAREFKIDVDDIQTGGGEAESERESLDDILSSVTAGAPDPFNNKGEKVGSALGDAGDDRVLVIKYYRKPDADEGFPEGRHWIIAGGTKVWPPENDPEYPNGEAPVPFGFWPPRVCCTDTPIPGQIQGMGVLSQVVPLNEKYNFNDGKIGEFHTMMAMGGCIWVHPDDKGMVITSEPGQVKPSKGYVHGKPPMREKLEALPAAVYLERGLIAENLRTIAGTSQLDMGQRPEGVSAGRAFLVMQEASDAAAVPTLTALEHAMEEVGRRELVIAQRKYTEPRTIKIRGEKGKWEFRSFTNADLRDGIDVRVQVGSSFPWSKSAQWDTKLSVLESSIGQQLVLGTDGKVDREQVARYLDAGTPGLAAFESGEDPDLVEIDREHAMFEEFDPEDPEKTNELPQLAVWQNQPKHQQHHFDFMKRSYARFLRWSPAAREQFIEHLRLTTAAVAELVNGALAASAPSADGEEQPPEGAEAPGAGPALVPSGGGPKKPKSTMQLTRGDRAAAGQSA